MKYLFIVFGLALMLSCGTHSNTTYTGVITERFYESGKYSTSGNWTYDQYHLAMKDTNGGMHLIETDQQGFLTSHVGDTLTFQD